MQGLVKENMFFYDHIEREAQESKIIGGQPTIVEHKFRHFVNLGAGNVMRGMQIADNLFVLILNDWREEKQVVPTIEKGKQVDKIEKRMMTTQIPIEGIEQVQKFLKQFDPEYSE